MTGRAPAHDLAGYKPGLLDGPPGRSLPALGSCSLTGCLFDSPSRLGGTEHPVMRDNRWTKPAPAGRAERRFPFVLRSRSVTFRAAIIG